MLIFKNVFFILKKGQKYAWNPGIVSPVYMRTHEVSWLKRFKSVLYNLRQLFLKK